MDENKTGNPRSRRRSTPPQPEQVSPRAAGRLAKASGAPAPGPQGPGTAIDDGGLTGSEPLLLAEHVTLTSVTRLDAADQSLAGEKRAQMIRERAFRYAEERGFEPGDELGDWLRAEREVDAGL